MRFVEFLLEWFAASPRLHSVLLAVALSVARVNFDGKVTTRKRVYLEAAIIGLLTFAVSSGLGAAGLNEAYATIIGAAMAVVGVSETREYLKTFISRKAESDDTKL